MTTSDIWNRPYEMIFLDMGNTLVQPVPSWDHCYTEAFRMAGRPIDFERVHRVSRAVWDEVVQRDMTHEWDPSPEADAEQSLAIASEIARRAGIDDADFHRAIHAYSEDIFNHPQSYGFFPDTLPALEALKAAGYRLGIISNWSWHLPDLCGHLALTPYLDLVVTSARVGRAKPHPAIFQAALAQAGVTPERAMHVGDSPYADGGAAGVGIQPVIVDRSGTLNTNGYPTVSSLQELVKRLGH